MSAEKKLLRQELRLRRSQVSSEIRKEKDNLIFQHLMQDISVQNADLLLAYASCGDEPDTWQLIRWALAHGKKLALPKCGQNQQMRFFIIHQVEDLQAGAHDILEPVTSQKSVMTEKSVCIVPAIAFTRKGVRLGQGGGYYDRFLKGHPDLYTIGIGYDFMIEDSLPCEAHDFLMKKIITDTEITEVAHEV